MSKSLYGVDGLMKFVLFTDWNLFEHHRCDGNNRGSVSRLTEAQGWEYDERREEVPEDTRSLTGVLLGDPLPQRSALVQQGTE
jgi:hypothetical protein